MKAVLLFATSLGLGLTGLGAAGDEAPGQPLAVSQVAHIRGMESPPLITTRVAPVYPRALREKGVQGFATVEVRVDSTGRVVDAELVRCTLPEFGERALQASRAWTFKPAMAQGRPITARVRLPFEFVMPQVAALEGR
jgi:TonB family protein